MRVAEPKIRRVGPVFGAANAFVQIDRDKLPQEARPPLPGPIQNRAGWNHRMHDCGIYSQAAQSTRPVLSTDAPQVGDIAADLA